MCWWLLQCVSDYFNVLVTTSMCWWLLQCVVLTGSSSRRRVSPSGEEGAMSDVGGAASISLDDHAGVGGGGGGGAAMWGARHEAQHSSSRGNSQKHTTISSWTSFITHWIVHHMSGFVLISMNTHKKAKSLILIFIYHLCSIRRGRKKEERGRRGQIVWRATQTEGGRKKKKTRGGHRARTSGFGSAWEKGGNWYD